ncbi:MAG: hypothetical protein MJ237_03695 [bacterium]|nr:hypothetical protein [bacterium]
MKEIDDRKFVSRLIMSVLTEQIIVREAIKLFPQTKDSSIECAYHALVHYDADEDMRKFDIEYRDAQDEYLENIAHTLSDGKVLPKNIIDEYKPYYKGTARIWKENISGIIEEFKRFINI